MELLDQAEITARLADEELAGWQQQDNTLHREFEFKDFTEAFGFMAQVACVAERLNHHPDWSNVWNKVSVSITNHSKGGITDLDFEFARQVSSLTPTS